MYSYIPAYRCFFLSSIEMFIQVIRTNISKTYNGVLLCNLYLVAIMLHNKQPPNQWFKTTTVICESQD